MATLTVNDNLNKRQLTELNKILSGLDRFITECDLAEQCSVDCVQRRADADALRLQVGMMKATYFPDAK